MDARQRWTLILTSVASLMVGLDLTVVTTALNTIRLDLGASIAELDWTINAYTLTIGVLLLTAAAVGDRLGRRRVLIAGLAVFTASSAACALAPSIGLVPLVRRHMAEAHGPRTPFDVAGLALSGAGLLGLVWGLIRGNAAGWGSPQVYGSLAAGTALIAAFVAWERRARSPMLPMSLFRNVRYVSANAAGCPMTAALMSGVGSFVQYLQASLGEGPLAAGVRLLPLTATLFVVAPIAGRFVARLGERPIVVVGMLGQTAGLVWIALATGGSYPALIPGMVLTGVGVSAAMPAAQN